MSSYVCPICGKSSCSSQISQSDYYYLKCNTYDFQFSVGEEIYNSKDQLRLKLFNSIFERMLRNPLKVVEKNRYKWYFFYDDSSQTTDDSNPNYINVAEDMKTYPRNAAEKVNRAMLNISTRYKNIGDIINWSSGGYENRMLFCDSPNQSNEFTAMYEFMRGLEYFDGDPFTGSGSISYKGWEKIDELNTNRKVINQGFIAMSFSEDAKSIMEVFINAIDGAGYKPQVISKKEHNNQIVPEIFHEIERSKFIVVDITYPNYGAYYEAGYAQALGKQVIVCCRKQEFESNESKPHFDIAQKAMIIWDTPQELKERLIKRIHATVN